MTVPTERAGDFSIRLDGVNPAATWNYANPAAPAIVLRWDNLSAPVREYRPGCLSKGSLSRDWADPLDALRSMEAAVRQRGKDSPPDRWIGYFSYDFGRIFERIPQQAADDLNLPLFMFSLHDSPHPHLSIPRKPRTTFADAQPSANAQQGRLVSTFSRQNYMDCVSRAIEYIRAGDVFQVNLSQRFSMEQTAEPSVIYDRLRSPGAAPYGALLDYGDFALICNSPELFFRVDPLPDGRRRITTRPIKGTRPRGPGLETELRQSLKDQAELNMIVDLERNDLGRICQIGTVRVTQPRTIETHPTLYHGVATIEGILREEVGLVDILRAMFPGGSITGAPKIRAMEIIDELEPVRRGPYCGAIGTLAADGSMEFNIIIRTMIVKEGLIHLPVGGGIVADSDPLQEYEETLVKAAALFAALGVSPGDPR